MKRQLVRSAVAAATCSILVLALAPGAGANLPTGSTVGFFHTDVGWVPAAPDTSGATGAACTPKLHADTGVPDFNNLVITATWLSMVETATPHAYVQKWDCDSRAVIGAFRMADMPLYSDNRDHTGWQYDYAEEVTRRTLRLDVVRDFLNDDPTFSGIVVIEAGAWWGKPDPATGRMVYYPAGCVQQSWLYTIIAWSGIVQAQPVGPEVPCAQPPLPGTPELL